jgi:KDEL-tailed cysteine endopeptidase
MKVLALLFGVALAWDQEFTLTDVAELDHLETFVAWANAFDRTYPSLGDEANKYVAWLDNLYIIAEHNSQDLSWKMGLNQFSDMTPDEFSLAVFGPEGSCAYPDDMIINHPDFEDPTEETEPLDEVDWQKKGAVTPVKNQGSCGSCWAFSATGAIECDFAVKNGKLNNLSEQQMVDCAGSTYGCNGCSGGQMNGAIRYAATIGQCLNSAYAYTAKKGTCKASSCGTKYNKPGGNQAIASNSESASKAAVAKNCVSVAVQAGQSAWQNYKSGVMTGTCGASCNHGVLTVGYGTSGGADYWRVKNSWGTSWGQGGYILVCRNCNKNGSKGQCGILTGPNVAKF